MQELKTPYYPILQIDDADELTEQFKINNLIHLWGCKNIGKIDLLIKKYNHS
jgi:hypothetical protein